MGEDRTYPLRAYDVEDEPRVEWPMTESRRVLEKYLHGGWPEVDESELDV